MDYKKIKEEIKALDLDAMNKATEYQNKLVKPVGSLGKLEDISIRLSGITGRVHNNIDKKILFLFGADNGVCEEGVSSAPQRFTNMLMKCYATGKGGAINVLTRENNVDLKLIDMGIIGDTTYKNVDNRKLMQGTNNFLKCIAIPAKKVEQAINIGIEYAYYAKQNGYDIIGTGEVGIGNTTTSSACIMACLSVDNADNIVGRGAGLSDDMFENKKQVISRGLMMHKPRTEDSVEIISKVGGLDIAALTGLYLGAAYYRIPIVVDGIISVSAALLADKLNSNVREYLFPSHVSEEPGYKVAAKYLNLESYLHLNMRLGEGTGCPLAMSIIENACAIINNMSTFDDMI